MPNSSRIAAPDAGLRAWVRHPDLIVPYLHTQWQRAFHLNISKIDNFLYVGGQFRAEQWAALHALGVRAVLSLQDEREDRFAGPPAPETLRLRVRDFHPPTIEQLREAMAFIDAARARQLPVMVHCHAGVGRASLTASAYLVAQGLPHDQAFHTIRRARPIVVLNNRQLARLREWEHDVARRAQL